MGKADQIKKAKELATKYYGKGKIEKALSQYRTLCKLEPNELRHRQKLADLLVKTGKKEKAIEEYTKVAEDFTKKGFLIKAIAVNKLILQVDPTRTEVEENLAELNAKRGLGKPRPVVRPAVKIDPAMLESEPLEKPEQVIQAEKEAAEEAARLEAEAKVQEDIAAPEPLEASDQEEAAVLEPADEPALLTDAPEEAGDDIVADVDEIDLEEADTVEPIELEDAVVEEEEEDEIPSPFPETPLFSNLLPEEFRKVVSKFQIGTLPKGTTVIKEGTQGDSFFIIASGKVRVYRASKSGKRRITLCELDEGSFFGEFAFLTQSKRSASVETLEESILLRINSRDLHEIIEEYPNVENVMNEFYKERVLNTLLAISPLFEILSEDDRKELIKKFIIEEAKPGDLVIEEGKEGQALYLIRNGEIDIVKDTDGKRVTLATLTDGDFFGEISLLNNSPTTASCIAKTKSSLFKLPRNEFNIVIMTHPQILEVVSTTVDKRLKSTKKLMAGEQDRHEVGLV